MKIIRTEDFVQEFEVKTIKCRKMGNQQTFYVPTINAVNFFGDSLEVFPMRFRDENEQIGFVFYLDMPDDYFYKPYHTYKLRRPYKTSSGEKRLTHSFYVPIPAMMHADLGIQKENAKLITMKGDILRNGLKAILIQKKKPAQVKPWGE